MKRKDTQTRKQQIIFISQFSILLAILALVSFTFLGSIPMLGIVATLSMIPVIIASILLGTKAGTLMGFFAGLFSFIVWTFMPPNPITAFIFTPFATPGNFYSLLIVFVPRILVGTVTGLTHHFFSKRFKPGATRDIFQYGISGILGSLTNTFLVLGGMTLFFSQKIINIPDLMLSSFQAILSYVGLTIVTNGVLEASLAFILALAICKPIEQYLK